MLRRTPLVRHEHVTCSPASLSVPVYAAGLGPSNQVNKTLGMTPGVRSDKDKEHP